jgi:hypothetical protein
VNVITILDFEMPRPLNTIIANGVIVMAIVEHIGRCVHDVRAPCGSVHCAQMARPSWQRREDANVVFACWLAQGHIHWTKAIPIAIYVKLKIIPSRLFPKPLFTLC